MKMVALKSMGRLRPGDEFEVNRTQARALVAVGKAKEMTESPPEPPPEPQPEPAPPEPEPQPDEMERAIPRYGRYRRRDMVSEE